VWENNELVGGLYGVSLGKVFFGESMFSKVSNASKLALISLANGLKLKGFKLIDSQDYTAHLESLGAREIPRTEFEDQLKHGLKFKSKVGKWTEWLK
jgi:leucyl/phenylalanyl-tRNA--protein transferase